MKQAEYRLGSRSALEWVIDQYRVKGESDPNREGDPGYIVRLVKTGGPGERRNGEDRKEPSGLSMN